MTVGERIKQRRLELGLSVDELAKRLNKNRATVYRYESNDIENLPTNVLEPLAKALDTTPSFLMGWDDKEQWNEEVKDYFSKTNAFEAQLSVLGWFYEHRGCYSWYESNELGLKDKKGTLVGCDGSKCKDCNEREQYYLFTNNEISFRVSIDDYDTFINDTQTFFKDRIQQLLNKSMKQLFSDNTIAIEEQSCTKIERFADRIEALQYLKPRKNLAAFKNGTDELTDDDIINLANHIYSQENN